MIKNILLVMMIILQGCWKVNKVSIENVEYLHGKISEDKLNFILNSLQENEILKRSDKPIEDGMRLLIQNETESEFIVHFGSAQPDHSGSGETFRIDKASGEVTSLETETYAPLPFDNL